MELRLQSLSQSRDRSAGIRFRIGVVLTAALTCCLSTSAADDTKPDAANAGDKVQPESAQLAFVRDKVRPLLESRCFECHGPKGEAKGGLRLTSRQAMLIGGESGPAVEPGKPDDSPLIQAVRYETFEMPPRTRMPAQEVDILVKWISEGAVWPESDDEPPPTPAVDAFPYQERVQSHWAWAPIQNPTVPAVKQSDWARDSADAFILHRLEERDLIPAPDADRRTLVRRFYYDVIGLPPTPEQVDAFVHNPAGDDEAIVQLVDELLASPHFGERWGRHWLDLVRYAETLGHEFDYPLREAFQYRDYVIRALNEDVPYDQFIREHLAGDLLPNPRRHPTLQWNESVIATGFWFLGEDKHAPVDVRAEEAGKIDNQIDVFSKAFLGLTVACARCHDHKFDAISAEDYYALAGFLQSSRRQTAWLDSHREIENRCRELSGLRTELTDALRRKDAASERTFDDVTRLLTSAVSVHRLPPKEADSEEPNESAVLFDDFERETFAPWQASGEAFAEGPLAGAPAGQRLSNFSGQRLVNSWRSSDRLQGYLRSPDFVIQHSGIDFLIAGGNHPHKTCINLVVDGKTVRTATGKNTDQMEVHSWDVSELRGKTARLEIIDHHSGGWGHIDIDRIVFTDRSSDRIDRAIAKVSEADELDANDLRTVALALKDMGVQAESSPLAVFRHCIDAAQGQSVGVSLTEWAAKNLPVDSAQDSETVLMADLTHGLPDGWFVNGQAFAWDSASDAAEAVADNVANGVVSGLSGETSGLQNFHPRSKTKSFSGLQWQGQQLAYRPEGDGGVSSATLSPELRGSLQSPTFELQHPEILIRVAGEGCRVRLVIDGYVMNEFSELLFRGARHDIKTEGRFVWIRLGNDVHRYVGHRAYLEFLDEGNGWFSVAEVRFAKSAGAQPPQLQPSGFNQELATALSVTLTKAPLPDDTAALKVLAQTWPKIAQRRPLEVATTFAGLRIPDSGNERSIELYERFSNLCQKLPAPVPVLAISDGTPEDEHIFIRGNHLNPGRIAPRRWMTVLRPDDQLISESSIGRLQLAEQLLAQSNPFPARVMVNRIWHHLFGEGIVGSTDNFGVLGKRPTHPELLDHLAWRFREEGWSIKRMLRSLLLSRTYRMSSQPSEAADLVDPGNELLHRFRVRRLEGEAVRDTILAVSGQLNRKMFGPSVPVYLTPFMEGRGRPASGPLNGEGRRSIYISVNRNFLSPLMLAFDVPAPVTTIGDRGVSNVPAQALILLNNEFVAEQSRLWAQRLRRDHTSAHEQLVQAWRQLLGREPMNEEVAMMEDFMAQQSAGDVSPEESLAHVCHVLLNSKEFLFLN